MNINTLTNYSLAAIAASMLLATTASAQDVEPTSVHQVIYSGGNFFQIDPNGWRETAMDSQTNYYLEMDRSERSVFLYDVGRRISLELDLYQRKVLRNDSGRIQSLGDITSSSNEVNARILKFVRFMNSDGALLGGIFRYNGQWFDFGDDGWPGSAAYVEVGRDDWTIQLKDEQHGIRANIHLANGFVTFFTVTGQLVRQPQIAFAQ